MTNLIKITIVTTSTPDHGYLADIYYLANSKVFKKMLNTPIDRGATLARLTNGCPAEILVNGKLNNLTTAESALKQVS